MSESILEFFEAEVFGEAEGQAFPLLSRIDSPKDLKCFSHGDLPAICHEIRHFIIQTLTRTGGHLSSNLGTVELATALHYAFDFTRDRIVWDVGHQAYPHKILTGRRGQFATLRQYKGLSGFLKREESEYDHFGAGHASTSISAALGMACARDLRGESHQVLALIGDGAMTGGMAFEALNQLGYLKKKVIVILNDNEMSISPNVGAMSGYLNQIISGQFYTRTREQVAARVKAIPGIGQRLARRAHQLEHIVKTLLVPGSLFQELGFHYVGPVNGHQVENLVKVFKSLEDHEGPVLVHVRTVKGKGFGLAEQANETYHGVGAGYLPKSKASADAAKPGRTNPPSYTQVFAQTLTRMAEEDRELIAITAAMPSGTGLDQFAAAHPDRFFDVGIAEQHAVTFAAGLAAAGKKPVAAIYSTFLQRAYDQVIHDVCLQNLDVTLCLDRAGLVGADGPTHHGTFDVAYLRIIPNLVTMAPADENELQHMVYTAVRHKGPAAVRYPRGNGLGVPFDAMLQELPLGRGVLLRPGKDLLLVGLGTMVHTMVQAAEQLSEQGIEAAVINPRFIKPLDWQLVQAHLPVGGELITLEDGCLTGGFGSALLEALQENGQTPLRMVRLGIKDTFVSHGDVKLLYRDEEMDADAVVRTARHLLSSRPHVSESHSR